MEATEGFNLRWNNFETNTRVTLKELQNEKEFCDVTLACDGKQVSAHKVILAGGSKFFEQILKQNPHPHPLLYLKGVKYEYLSTILDFVYTGEANINQKELDSFLDVATDLQIKGFSEKNASRSENPQEGEKILSNLSHQDQFSDTKKDAGLMLHAKTLSRGNNRVSQNTNEPLTGNIKVEPDDTIHSTVSFGMEENNEDLNNREDVMDFKAEVPNTYETGRIVEKGRVTDDWCEQGENFNDDALRSNSVKLAPVFTFPDQSYESYEDGVKYTNVSVRYDEERGENNSIVPGDNFTLKENMKTYTEEKAFRCLFCPKTFSTSFNLKVHTRTHTGEKPFQCLECPKTFSHSSHLKRHQRVHTDNPFQCLSCFKRFNQLGALTFHMKQQQCSMKLGK